MKKIYPFAVLLLSLCTTSLSAKEKPGRLYGILDGYFSFIKQFQEKETGLSSIQPERELILKTEFEGGFGLGLGYEFKESGISRIEAVCGIGNHKTDYDYKSDLLDQKSGSIYAQIGLVWVSNIRPQLKWTPEISFCYSYEWIHDTKSAQGQIQYGYNMHAPFIDLSPLTFEYKATDSMQFQFSVGDIGLIQVDADGIEKKYYSFVASFNTFSTRMIFRF